MLIPRSDLDTYLAQYRQERAGMAGRVAAVVHEVMRDVTGPPAPRQGGS